MWLTVTAGAGHCELAPSDDGGRLCVTDGPGSYGPGERCTVEVRQNGRLTFEAPFETEDGNDYLVINGERHSGDMDAQEIAAVNLAVSAGDNFTWHSDAYVDGTGWTVCWEPPLRVASGESHCQLNQPGNCVSDGDGAYGNNERCAVEVLAHGRLSTTGLFATEATNDYLAIEGHSYSGRTGFADVAVPENATLTWSTDAGSVGPGWTVCWDKPLPTASPTTTVPFAPGPMPSPTTSDPTPAPMPSPTTSDPSSIGTPPQSSSGEEDTGNNLVFIIGGAVMGAVIVGLVILTVRQRAHLQPTVQHGIPPVNNPAFNESEPEYAAMNYAEIGPVMPPQAPQYDTVGFAHADYAALGLHAAYDSVDTEA